MDLLEYIENCVERRFEYGVFDCCVFASGCVHCVTGIDVMKDLRGLYGRDNYHDIIDTYGSLENAVTFHMGTHPVEPDLLTDGAPVLIRVMTPSGEMQNAISVKINGGLYIPTAVGLAIYPLENALMGWRV